MRKDLRWMFTPATILLMTAIGRAEEEVTGEAATKPAGEEMLVQQLRTLNAATVYGSDGKLVGHVNGIAVNNARNRIEYAIVEFDRLRNFPDKKFAVPWKAFQKKVQLREEPTTVYPGGAAGAGTSATTREEFTLTMNVDRAWLDSAKGIEGGKWPALTESSRRDMYTQWKLDPDETDDIGDKKSVRIEGTPVSPGREILVRAADLNGHDILDQNGADIADLEAVIVEAHSGRLLHGIVQLDKRPDLKVDYMHPVPMRLLEVSSTGEDQGETAGQVVSGKDAFKITLSITKDKLQAGPKFPERKWPKMDHTWVQSVDSAYGVETADNAGR